MNHNLNQAYERRKIVSYEPEKSFEPKKIFYRKNEIKVLNKYGFWEPTVRSLLEKKANNIVSDLEKTAFQACAWCNSGCSSCGSCGSGEGGCAGCNSCNSCS